MSSKEAENTQRQQMDKPGFLKILDQWVLRHGIRRPHVQVSSSSESCELKVIGGTWMPVSMVFIMLSSFSIPYFIILVRGTLYPFLPYISQVGASPPQSGVFCILLVASAVMAYIGTLVLHMIFQVRSLRLEDEWVRQIVSFLNNLSMVPAFIGTFGMFLVAAFPLDFYRKTDQWMAVIVMPHLIGALSLFLGGLFYCIIVTYIMAMVHPQKKRILGIRIVLLSLITMLSALQGYTVRDGFIFPENEQVTNCEIVSVDVQYNLSYLISSVCEWCLVFAFLVFFLTLKEEGEDICFCVNVKLSEEYKPKENLKESQNVSNSTSNGVLRTTEVKQTK